MSPALVWTSPPGGKRYRADLGGGRRVDLVRRNVAAGGPRWMATYTNRIGEQRVIARGDSMKNVRDAAERAVEGTVNDTRVANDDASKGA